jgi:hypothetical protein
MNETTEHLLYVCNYTEADWNAIASIFHLPHYALMSYAGGPMEWIKNLQQAGYTEDKRKKLGILFMFWWFIWRERNSRIFYDKHKSF